MPAEEGQPEGDVGGSPRAGTSGARAVPAGEGQKEEEVGGPVATVEVEEADSTFDDRDGEHDLTFPYQGLIPASKDSGSDLDRDESLDATDEDIEEDTPLVRLI